MPNKKLKKQPQLVQSDKVCTGCFYFKKKNFNICPKDEKGKVLCVGFKIWV